MQLSSTSVPRRCLVTGGAGFIGSHLVEALLAAGHDVTVIDNLSTGRPDNLQAVLHHPRFQLVQGNVADRTVMEPLVAACEDLYHLASYVGVKLAMQTPSQTILNNLRNIDTLLELVSKYRPRFLLTSTSEIYGKALDHLPVNSLAEHADRVYGSTEVHRWSYAGIKAVEEFLTLARHQEEGIHTVIVRLFNVIGPRQIGKHGPVVPRFIEQALAGEPITIYGDGGQRRCFTFVEDAVRAIRLLIELPDAGGEVFNVGGCAPVSVAELARSIVEQTASTSEITFVPYESAYGDHFEDVQLRIPDTTKLTEWTGFAIDRSMEDVLQRIIEAHPAYSRTGHE